MNCIGQTTTTTFVKFCSNAGISKTDIKFMSSQLDVLLRPTMPSSAMKDSAKHSSSHAAVGSLTAYGTGEEQQSAIIASCDSLSKLLRSAIASSNDLPLSITAIHGVSPTFRFSEVTVHCLTILDLMLCCVLKLCSVISTLRWAVLTVLWIGFCHTGPISLCVIYLSLCNCVFCVLLFHTALHMCCIIVSTVGWTWWDWSLILRTVSSFGALTLLVGSFDP